MDPNKSHVSRLESLPQDLLGDIVTKIALTSPEDYQNCVLSCKGLGAMADDERVCKKLSLAPLVRRPLAANKYKKVMDNCLVQNNPDAHYIKGILQYFHHNDKVSGLYHFLIAADAGHTEAVYLYAIILLCSGLTATGKSYLGQLKWEEDKTILDKAWNNIKISLTGIAVPKETFYIVSLRNMKNSTTCHIYDMDTNCANCFYYKQMLKFINLT